jgi:hypothetical protein
LHRSGSATAWVDRTAPGGSGRRSQGAYATGPDENCPSWHRVFDPPAASRFQLFACGGLHGCACARPIDLWPRRGVAQQRGHGVFFLLFDRARRTDTIGPWQDTQGSDGRVHAAICVRMADSGLDAPRLPDECRRGFVIRSVLHKGLRWRMQAYFSAAGGMVYVLPERCASGCSKAALRRMRTHIAGPWCPRRCRPVF